MTANVYWNADMPVARARNVRAAAHLMAAARASHRSSDNPAKSVAGLGAKLKSARERSGVSVRGLARNVDVSPSLISQIENGLAMPSVGTLYAIVSELGLGLDELFQGKPRLVVNGRPKSEEMTCVGPVRRGNSREVIRLADGVRWELLTPRPDPELEFLYVVYEVGAESCDKDLLVRHGGMEYAYIISGRLGVRIGFNEYELNPGDSISFDAQSPHRLWTVGSKPAVAIWAVHNRSGDRRTRRKRPARVVHPGNENIAKQRTRKNRRRR
jgi:transcriptional regulator with XRE-family HTH domain